MHGQKSGYIHKYTKLYIDYIIYIYIVASKEMSHIIDNLFLDRLLKETMIEAGGTKLSAHACSINNR